MNYQLLLALRIGLVVVLYFAVLQVVFVARRELRHDGKAAKRGMTRAREVIGHLIVIDAGSAPLVTGTTFDVEPITTIGRDPTNSIRLDYQAVSANHARIIYRDRALWIEDTNSRNGVWIDAHKLEPEKPVAVSPGSILQVGDTRFRLTV